MLKGKKASKKGGFSFPERLKAKQIETREKKCAAQLITTVSVQLSG